MLTAAELLNWMTFVARNHLEDIFVVCMLWCRENMKQFL